MLLLKNCLQMTCNANYNSNENMNTTALLSELNKLEQQNRIQIELIRRILKNKYDKINVNEFLRNVLNQKIEEDFDSRDFFLKSTLQGSLVSQKYDLEDKNKVSEILLENQQKSKSNISFNIF